MMPPSSESHEISVKEMIASIYSDIATTNNKIINFAMAVSDPSLPTAKLNKSVVQACTNSKNHCVYY